MRRIAFVLFLAAAVAAVAVSAASAGNKPPPPQASFYADWNGSPTCDFGGYISGISATCTDTASAWWYNAPAVRSVRFDFYCDDWDYGNCSSSSWNPSSITVNSRVPGSQSGSANTSFNFTDSTCIEPGYYFRATFLDSKGRTLGQVYSDSYATSCVVA